MNAPGPAIRQARANDAPALRQLVERAYRGDSARQGWTHEADLIETDRTSLDELLAVITDPDRVVLVAPQDGQMLGTVTIARVAADLCYLGMLAVDPQIQAGGLGRRLVGAAEAAARDHFGAARMEMTVIAARRELIAWYQRQGYGLTGESRLLPGMEREDLRMEVLERQLSIVQPCDSPSD
ncbi:MAG: GNAT family N-acetyltransferase [Proteobacteria bacterium]|nr:GNAT family N-acetyltransferase [Pseudomonadota bacterium]